jgi:hypothetical protein
MGHVNVGLNSRAEDLLDWAEKKMTEELELEVLANSNPTIKDLMETISRFWLIKLKKISTHTNNKCFFQVFIVI